jgi:glyoxylase-like metal-dependent hydrolase (beta-lactamase superfamily II)
MSCGLHARSYSMIFEQIPLGPMQNFAYLIGDEKTGQAAVVDPAWDVSIIKDIVKRHNLRVIFIIDTHNHHDHTSGNDELAETTGAKVVAHDASKLKKDISVKDGDVLQVGSLEVRFIHTPGHSPDSMSVLVGNKLMSGDTLFVGECGRTDLPGGSSEQLYDSLFNKLAKLPDEIEVYPGHDYGAEPHSTIAYEKAHNYVLKPRTVREFIQFMKEP